MSTFHIKYPKSSIILNADKRYIGSIAVGAE